MPDVRQLITTAAVAVLAIAGYQAVHDTSPAPAAASSPRASGMLQPFMRFTGSGTTTMRPDQGTVSFSTHGTGDTLLDAQNQASQAMHSLIAKLNADGVPGIEMQTNGVEGYKRQGALRLRGRSEPDGDGARRVEDRQAPGRRRRRRGAVELRRRLLDHRPAALIQQRPAARPSEMPARRPTPPQPPPACT